MKILLKVEQALFSKNYSTAEIEKLSKVPSFFLSKGDFEKAKKLMIEMSENYKVLIDLFPENTEDEFELLEALPRNLGI